MFFPSVGLKFCFGNVVPLTFPACEAKLASWLGWNLTMGPFQISAPISWNLTQVTQLPPSNDLSQIGVTILCHNLSQQNRGDCYGGPEWQQIFSNWLSHANCRPGSNNSVISFSIVYPNYNPKVTVLLSTEITLLDGDEIVQTSSITWLRHSLAALLRIYPKAFDPKTNELSLSIHQKHPVGLQKKFS